MNKYFFFDRRTLSPQGMDNVQIEVCRLQKDTANNPLFHEDYFSNPPKKWEVRYDNGYPNVFYDKLAQKFRCYYTMFSFDPDSAQTSKKERAHCDYKPRPDRVPALGYAESDDGIHWVKPNLGLVEINGSKENNLILNYAHGTGVLLDYEETDEKRRYKMITKMDYPGGPTFMAISFSADGIHWCEVIPWPQHNPPADSLNLPFRDKKDGKFKMISRVWHDGIRVSTISESSDFISWSEPREILRGNGFESQVYSMPVFQYEGLYIGLASVIHEGNRSAENFDNVDCELVCANNIGMFDHVADDQYVIPRGQGKYPDGEFDCGCIYASVPIEHNGKLIVYYMGGNGQHTNFRETSFARGFLEKDKFAYYTAIGSNTEGVLPTSQFHIYGENLSVLADVETDGYIEAALYDRWNGKAFPGFDFSDCQQERQQDGYLSLKFDRSMLSLGTDAVCLMIRFKNAKIYALGGDLILQAHRLWEGAI